MTITHARVLRTMEEVGELCDRLIATMPRPRHGEAGPPPLPLKSLLQSAIRQAGNLILRFETFEPHVTFIAADAAQVVLLRDVATLPLAQRRETAGHLRRVVESGGVYGRLFMAVMTTGPLDLATDAIQLVASPETTADPKPMVVIVASSHEGHVIELLEVHKKGSGLELRNIDPGVVTLVPEDDPLLSNPFAFLPAPNRPAHPLDTAMRRLH